MEYFFILEKSDDMIFRNNSIFVEELDEANCLELDGQSSIFDNALFLDLEHYIYKKPVCVGVFGCCYYNAENKKLSTSQYMIENKRDSKEILNLAKEYFLHASEELGIKSIITFSGNNDFTVLNYLFDKYNIDYIITDHFQHIDLQKLYEKEMKINIGLKNLEKLFDIHRDSELISGSNLAKTFSKIMKDFTYIERMPFEKKTKILLYNEQDIVSLFYLTTKWKKALKNIAAIEEVKKNIDKKD